MRRAAQQPLSLGDLEARNPGERLSPDPEHCVRDGGGGGDADEVGYPEARAWQPEGWVWGKGGEAG